jgi:hypothetical protein
MMKQSSRTMQLSFPGHDPVCHWSTVSGNHDGKSIGSSMRLLWVFGGYSGHVRLARSS